MLHDIFKKLKRKQKPEKVPIIIADIHEKNSLVLSELKSSSEITLEMRSLKIADYIIGEAAIERKTVSDLISSMISKRLRDQLIQIKEYKKQFLIVEGSLKEIYKENDGMAKAVRGLLISVMNNYSIPIIFSVDHEDTAKYLITLAKQQVKKKSPLSLHARIPKTVQEQKKYILESFPNIGPKKAQKLLEKFSTLQNVFNASEENLIQVLKNQAKEFKDILSHKD
ncbi:MAG: hypothetical protein RL557_849 [archaeon]|jgi:Fanconi anemia group M protein